MFSGAIFPGLIVAVFYLTNVPIVLYLPQVSGVLISSHVRDSGRAYRLPACDVVLVYYMFLLYLVYYVCALSVFCLTHVPDLFCLARDYFLFSLVFCALFTVFFFCVLSNHIPVH
jgi:hypothetical protein